MKKSTKALLCSIFLLPGSGHIIFKKYKTGIALVTVSVIALVIFVGHAVTIALLLSEKIINGELASDLASITNAVNNHLSASQTQYIEIASGVLIIIWLFAIIDVYRISKTHKNSV